MLKSGTRPPAGRKLSCIAFTAPVLVPVVTVAKSPAVSGPKRVSLPSIFPADWSTCCVIAVGRDGLERSSLDMATNEPAERTIIMTAARAQPCLALPAIRPKVFVRANGITRISNISNQFVIVVGFSKG